jgi:xylan 1,4-beta-xylosidase
VFDPRLINQAAFSRYRALTIVQAHVDQFPTQALSLQAAAHIACREPKYFSTFFHAKVGVCFKAWETYRRAKRARAYVEQTDRPITEIALECGFGDLRTFERAFRRCFDTTPQVLRRLSVRKTCSAARG